MLTAHCVRDALRRCLRSLQQPAKNHHWRNKPIVFERIAGGLQTSLMSWPRSPSLAAMLDFAMWHMVCRMVLVYVLHGKGTVVALSRCRIARNGVLTCLARV